MAAIKIHKFLGIAPKISPELLPDGAGQIASGLKLYSGDLLPYTQPVIVDDAERTGAIQTIYGMKATGSSTIDWLSWLADVDIAVASDTSDDEQRFYYTGDGVPKVSNYALATTGSAPYPLAYYDLGLPLPTTVPTTVAVSPTTSTSATYARDAGNIATIVTGAAHNLRTGNIVTIAGFTTSPSPDWNATNVYVTVVDTTTFTYYNAGALKTTTANTEASISLAGNTVTRSYVYTWMTPWGEESIASDPSTILYLKEGQTVTVTNLPTAGPGGTDFVEGIRLYRTIASASGTEYFLLDTLWFPLATTLVSLTSNIATVTTSEYHSLIVGDRFKISGCTDTVFNITDGIVLTVPTDYSFTYAVTNADIAEKADATGTVFHDVAEVITDTARYWGDGSYTFSDDFAVTGLSSALLTYDYDAPDASMVGITTGSNEMIIGFFDNQLCFAEPNAPHAWPIKYRKTIEYDIVGVEAVGGYTIVLTEEYSYRVSGNHPATVSVARVDTPYPCLSKRSIVNMGYGVLWATHGGLAIWSPRTGIALATQYIEHYDTWDTLVDPSTVNAYFYNDRYLATHSAGAFIFERDEKTGGFFVTLNVSMTASWTDPVTNFLYYISGTGGDIYQWDKADQPLTPAEWKSKVILTKDYINLGAARVIADFPTLESETLAVTAYNLTVATTNAAVWAVSAQLGGLNGPSDYAASTPIHGEVNAFALNGDSQTASLRAIVGATPVTFRLWADKTLLYTGTITDDGIFRLPHGYKSDTFEVGVSGSARVRAIHLGETPYGLRRA